MADIDYQKRDYKMARVGAMETERTTFMDHWRELAEFVQPRRGRFLVTDVNKGDKRYQKIINGHAGYAHKVARAGMLSGVMSPTRPWFQLEHPDPDLMEVAAVKEWLYAVQLKLLSIFNAGNLYNMAPSMLGELLLFGTGCMMHVDDYEDVARFYTHTVGSYALGQNDKFQIDTFVQRKMRTVEQLASEFGLENCSQAVKNLYDKGTYDTRFEVIHIIEPNRGYDGAKPQAKYKKWKSCYFQPDNPDKDKYLKESGFDEFPIYAPRWEVTGEDIYATDCPGMTALGDIKGLQIEEKRKAQGIDKMVNPPLKGPASLKHIAVNSLPGGMTAYDGNGNAHDALAPVYMVQPRIGELMEDINKVEQRINRAFFVDMFLAISSMEGIQPRNEFELSQRNQERLLQLGPVLEQLHGEFLNRLIERTFNQGVRAKIFPPAPPDLAGKTLRVKYISTLAMAQRSVATGGIDRLAAFGAGLVKAGWTGALDKFDADQAMDEYASVIGVPPRVIVSDDVVEDRRQQRAKQQQQADAMAMAQQGAEIAKTASDVKLSEGVPPGGISQ